MTHIESVSSTPLILKSAATIAFSGRPRYKPAARAPVI
jgi:hypothetical protein